MNELLFWLLIVFLTAAIYYSVRYLNALKYRFGNKIKCGQIACDPDFSDITGLPDSTVDVENWQNDIAHYSLYLVNIMSQALTNKTDFVFPEYLNVIGTYSAKKGEPGIVTVLSDDNNNVWIPIRGTKDLADVTEDVDMKQTTWTINNQEIPVHKGFFDYYKNIRDNVLGDVNAMDSVDSIVVSGHSLGAAIATLLATELKLLGYNVICYAIASPRVGGMDLSELISSSGLKLFRLVNTEDIVPTFPPAVYRNFCDPKNPYQYIHSGTMVSFTSNWFSVLNNHIIPVYADYLKNQ